VGVSADTVRYYGRAGLLPELPRSHAGYRLYEPEAVDRLRFIKGAQRLGLRLREVRELMEVRDRGICPCGHAEELVRQRVLELDEEIADLRRVKKQLVELVGRLPADAQPSRAGWPCEVEFIRASRTSSGGEDDGGP
jgi:DNA-binding transcriptional MerR regulator